MVSTVKYFQWSEEKDAQLRAERGISFSDVVAVMMGEAT